MMQNAGGVWADDNSSADLAQSLRALVNVDVETGFQQTQRR
jgi:hypothetical protein